MASNSLFNMTKIENHRQDLSLLFATYFQKNNSQQLKEYIIANSNLPGPRGNIDLAQAFADIVENHSEQQTRKLWHFCTEFIKISADEAPTNDPRELIPFCGANGIGAIGSISPQYFEPAILNLKLLANDSRWRMREAVCFGLQCLLAKRALDTMKQLKGWIGDGTLLELRAVVAAVAEPPILKNQPVAIHALNLQKGVLNRFLNTAERKSEPARVLRKALGFAISVVVGEIPEPGFEFMFDLANSNDPDTRWILKENLKKHRLVKKFPNEIELLNKLLQ